jgi:hypothetical protein
MTAMNETDQQLHDRLNNEAAKIPWRELQRHYARGAIIVAGAELDLIDTAMTLASDDYGATERWTEQGGLRRANDDDARDWLARDVLLWAVVIAPWVLVQEPVCPLPR